MSAIKRKILVVRNDKLGDFMLTWPTFATVRKSLPDCEIHALVSSYTADMAKLCPNIDQLILDPEPDAPLSAQLRLLDTLRRQKYDAAITLFSTTRIGCLLMLAGIPYRLAPATKIAQVFYHKRLKQRRSRSEKPEYTYNRDLAVYYLKDTGIEQAVLPTPPYLEFPHVETQQLRDEFCRKHGVNNRQSIVFIHPGSGGSANNISLAQYAELGRNLKSAKGHHIIISAGPGEHEQAEKLATMLGDTPHTVYLSKQGLESFARHIAFADLFISGSTGPLHIAGALNCRTAAFYPRRRSATSLRWQTINSEANQLAFSPPPDATQEDMSCIDMTSVAHEISSRFLLG